jgi:RNA 3'-terminal phosphate cyclase (ATP)
LKLRGWTNAIQAPQIDYTENIFLPFIAKHFGIQTRLRIKKRGYWPKGGGEVHVDIPIREMGKPLPFVQITSRGNITSITGFAYVAGLPKSMAKKMQDAAIQHILSNYTLTHDKIDISARREPEGIAVGRGSGVFLWAETDQGHRIAGSSIGSKDLELEDVAITAAKELLSNLEHGGCVDEYLQVSPRVKNIALQLKPSGSNHHLHGSGRG